MYIYKEHNYKNWTLQVLYNNSTHSHFSHTLAILSAMVYL